MLYVNPSGDDNYNGFSPEYDPDTGDGPKASIQNAIDTVDDNGTVYVAGGTYFENLLVNKNLILIGEGRDNTIIDGQQAGSVIIFYGSNFVPETFTFILSGFTITNGKATAGGGMYIFDGVTVLINLLVTGNIVSGVNPPNGGGIYNNGGLVYADMDSVFINGNFHTSIIGNIPDELAGGDINYVDINQAALKNNRQNPSELLGLLLNLNRDDPDNTIVAANSVGMQQTGIPVNYLIMAVLMVIGGILLPKKE